MTACCTPKKARRSVLFVTIATLLCSPFAPAADYVYSDTIDLGAVSQQTSWNWNLDAPAFSLVTGDTLSGTISFAGNQRLQFNAMGGGSFDIWARLFSPVLVTGNLTKTTTLNDLQGTIIGENPQEFVGGGIAIAMIFAEAVGQAPNSFSISGFHYSATMTSISGSFESQPGGYLSAAVTSGNGSISVIPEPRAFGLLALGGVALTFCQRRNAIRTMRRWVGRRST